MTVNDEDNYHSLTTRQLLLPTEEKVNISPFPAKEATVLELDMD
jgi:hypothetical protein